MKKISILLSCALAMGMWSCTSEDSPKNAPEENEGDVYATLSLDFGNTRSTRSETVDPGDDNPSQSDAGFEIGQDDENNVETLIVVLATRTGEAGNYTYTRLTDSGICNASPVNSSVAGASNPIYRVKFSSKELQSFAGQEIFVFAYCNPTVSIVQAFENGTWNPDQIEKIGHADNSYIWAKNHFLMTSAMLHPFNLPSTDELNTLYNGINNPLDLGIVKVHRVAARFDFGGTTVEGESVPNRYPIYDYVGTEDNEKGELQGYVTIDGLSLFNQAKEFYMFSRVANNIDGQIAPDLSKTYLLGQETRTNWVISPTNKTYDYSLQANDGKLPNPSEFNYTSVSDILGGTADKTESWTNPSNTDYYIWRYTTENTIPGVSDQIHGISTGVLFRGYISGAEGSDLASDINEGKPLYTFQGVMYGNLESLRKYVANYPGSALSVAFQADFNVEFDESHSKEDIEKIIANAQDLTASSKYFNVYTASKVGDENRYYVYYYYYNRHNDNGNNVIMGPMEFATVRNNVYKLRVSNIYQWGNPGDKPTDPDDPDEEPEVYFRVRVEVLPWVVRVNDIEF